MPAGNVDTDAKNYAEDNDIFERFKVICWNCITDYPTLSAHQISSFYRNHDNLLVNSNHRFNTRVTSIEKYIKVVIERKKSKPGDTTEDR